MKKREVMEALTDIFNFHEDGFNLEDLEEKYGFLGWTCCSELRTIAGIALGLKMRGKKR